MRVLDGLAHRVRSSRRLLQVVVEGLERVADRHVLEKPCKELGVALRDLDGEAGRDPAGGALGSAGWGGADPAGIRPASLASMSEVISAPLLIWSSEIRPLTSLVCT